MSNEVLIVILAVAVLLSLFFSIAAFILQFKRYKRQSKEPAGVDTFGANAQTISSSLKSESNTQQNEHTQFLNGIQQPDIEASRQLENDETQSLFSSPRPNPVPGNVTGNQYGKINCKIKLNESSPKGDRTYDVNVIEELTIGRNETNGLVIDDSTVSGLQCVITAKSDAVFVENRSSSNLTRLNGTVFSSILPIRVGDILKIGKVTITILDIS